jgi:hypothetical protein
MLGGQHGAVDFEDGRGRIVEQMLDRAVDGAELGQQLAHVLGAAARCGLVGHRGHPVDQIVLEQAAQAHQHARHGAVAADVVPDAAAERILDHVQVDRIQHDDGVVLHAQRRRRVDPVAVPAGRAQLRVHLGGVVAALARDDDLALRELGDIQRAFQFGLVLRHRWRIAARVRRGEEHRLDMVEIAFVLHTLHQDRTDHAAPTNQTN